ncbi:hypothetical protein SEA_EVY_238 [Streptomyces phage Evy]|uniref:Uncharacterized protein n=1 Tax=Streptomyces phage Evy TaxID=2588514 RepID=A0A514DKG2_9CAUD|nr:hypothetical protein KNU67_gp060 [Streptomyces phage Evy]QDH94072.1 hypothetical protein SEA_EVY_238 [Streptomyces phage Evy]
MNPGLEMWFGEQVWIDEDWDDEEDWPEDGWSFFVFVGADLVHRFFSQ